RLGVSKQTLWNWETDRTLPQPRFLAALAEALMVPASELGDARAADPTLAGPADPADGRDAAIAHHKARLAELLDVEPGQVEIVVRFWLPHCGGGGFTPPAGRAACPFRRARRRKS